MTPDALAKTLYPFLIADFPPEQLRAAEWLTFLKYDHPKTDDPTAMGARAVVYLFANASNTDRCHAFARIVAFVVAHQQDGKWPSAAAMRDGLQLVRSDSLDEDAICAWLRGNCR